MHCRNVDIKRSADSAAPFELQLLSTDMLHEQMGDRLGTAAEGAADAAAGGAGGAKGKGSAGVKGGKQVDLGDDDTENQQKVKRPPAKKARKGVQEAAA